MNSALHRLLRSPITWFQAGVLASLYLDLFILPDVPIWMTGDNSVYLLNATRMSEGQVMYRDFSHFVPPGTEWVYRFFFAIFGIRAWIPNLLLMLLGLGLTWAMIRIARQVVAGGAAFLPALVFLTFVYRRAFDGIHHWYSMLAVLAAVAVVLTERTYARLAAAAMLCGLASCFTQTTGVVAAAGLAFFILWERAYQGAPWKDFLKKAALLLGVFSATTAVACAVFSREVGLRRFFESTVVFLIRYYPRDLRWNTFRVYLSEAPSIHPWFHLPALGVYLFVHALTPLVYLVFIVRYARLARHNRQEPWDRLMLLNIVGLTLFIGITPAPDWVRLGTVSFPGLIILVWFLQGSGRLRRVFAWSLWTVAVVLALAEPCAQQVHWHGFLDLPRGRAAFLSPEQYNEFKWLQSRTRPGEFLFEANFPDVYYLLGVRDPAKVPFLTPSGYTRPQQVRQALAALERDRVRFVIWSVYLDIPYRNGVDDDSLGPLRDYLHNHYKPVKTFGTEQVWERRG